MAHYPLCSVWSKCIFPKAGLYCHTIVPPGSYLCGHKGQGVQAMGRSQQTTDHSQATTVQEQGDQQTQHSHMAVEGSGRGE